MSPKKVPDSSITQGQLMDTTTIGTYLRAKLAQLGLSQAEVAQQLGYNVTPPFAKLVNDHPDAFGFSSERVHHFITIIDQKQQELGLGNYNFDEQTHFKSLNDQTRKTKTHTTQRGSRHQPDITITTEQLMQSTTLAEYLNLKLKQTGTTQRDANTSLGSLVTTLLKGSRNTGFEEEGFTRLLNLLSQNGAAIPEIGASSDAEKAHANALNALLPPSPKPAKKEKFTDKPKHREEKDTGPHGAMDGQIHIPLPKQMFDALARKDAARWNELKTPLPVGKRYFMRGIDASLLSLSGFDFSQCDLVGMKWPKNPNYANPDNLKGALLVAPEQSFAQDHYYHIPMRTRMIFQKQNPDFNPNSLRNTPPAPTVLHKSPEPTPPAESVIITPPPAPNPPVTPAPVVTPSPVVSNVHFEGTLQEFVIEHLKASGTSLTAFAHEISLTTQAVSMQLGRGIKQQKEQRLNRLATALGLDEEGRAQLEKANRNTLNQAAGRG